MGKRKGRRKNRRDRGKRKIKPVEAYEWNSKERPDREFTVRPKEIPPQPDKTFKP